MLLNVNSSLSQPSPSFLTTVNPVKLRCLLAPLSLDCATVIPFRFPFTDLFLSRPLRQLWRLATLMPGGIITA